MQLLEIALRQTGDLFRVRRRFVGQFIVQAAIAQLMKNTEVGQDLGLLQQQLNEYALEEDVDAERPGVPHLHEEPDGSEYQHGQHTAGPFENLLCPHAANPACP